MGGTTEYICVLQGVIGVGPWGPLLGYLLGKRGLQGRLWGQEVGATVLRIPGSTIVSGGSSFGTEFEVVVMDGSKKGLQRPKDREGG